MIHSLAYQTFYSLGRFSSNNSTAEEGTGHKR